MESTLIACCFWVLLTVSGAVKNDLRCYQCNVSDNMACTEEYLMQCPDKQAYDRCETRVRKAANGERWIQKGCALSPCNLGTLEELSLGIHCDYSAPNYDCVTCCKEDGCNTGCAAGLLHPGHTMATLLSVVLTATLGFHLFEWV
ncbi:hypothetical protein C7M84_015078 [Penaeus vannamei]|uniref:Uncharacterized protein n=1 Tax=Penaeus vannamei TaxID=6689 RepID=A0A423SRT4_PENVA|nr:uncharacterized protein LOC113818236 [Penaeus vannamei]ROT66886.1 hypothetical protein C7M84_015078 [Penaeus vannamei]